MLQRLASVGHLTVGEGIAVAVRSGHRERHRVLLCVRQLGVVSAPGLRYGKASLLLVVGVRYRYRCSVLRQLHRSGLCLTYLVGRGDDISVKRRIGLDYRVLSRYKVFDIILVIRELFVGDRLAVAVRSRDAEADRLFVILGQFRRVSRPALCDRQSSLYLSVGKCCFLCRSSIRLCIDNCRSLQFSTICISAYRYCCRILSRIILDGFILSCSFRYLIYISSGH